MLSGVNSVSSALIWANKELSLSSASARLDAELILGFVLSCTRLNLITNNSRELTFSEQQQFIAYSIALALRQLLRFGI